jgi:shikimate dehydrogenase
LRSRVDEEVLGSDLLVNASPVGMHKGDPCIVNPKALHRDLVVYDIVYNPPATPLLKEAKRHGIKVSNGLGMLLYQGALSFELFTGRKAPVSVMRAALKKAVKKC